MKEKLQAFDAWKRLNGTLKGEESANNFECKDQSLELFRKTLEDPPDISLSPRDKLVRFRQALRFGSIKNKNFKSLLFPKIGEWPDIGEFANFNLTVRSGRVFANPWKPEWIEEDSRRGVDHSAMSLEKREYLTKQFEADPWIQKEFEYENYTGKGQALAVRSVINMPEDKTLLIILPTGEGKSFIYQALWKFQRKKTIAVVVPTVTLAQDQENELHNNTKLKSKQFQFHAHVGGKHRKNSTIKDSIPSGKQGLFFSSPQSMLIKLRTSLIDAAERGNLGAFVIDEAHIVHAWGTDFRSEFQELAALVSELRSKSPENKKPKIILLSATVETESLETLNSFFSLPGNPISIISATRLRPEQEIWVSPKPIEDEEVRKQMVLESLMNLPRPAILYATEPEEVNKLYDFLKKKGFKNLEKVHGNTNNDKREDIVKKWKTGDLDLVVGNAAFGLGINYRSARTVIHACVPEDISRYYQEIGRTGRDNLASISLLLHTKRDLGKANNKKSKSLITTPVGLPRWKKMFDEKIKTEEDDVFLIDTSVRAKIETTDWDFNVRWNHRVLNLMQLCGLIQMRGTFYDFSEEIDGGAKNYMKVFIGCEGHTKPEFWKKNIESRIRNIHESSNKGFNLMVKLLNQKECPSNLFEDFYTIKNDQTTFDVTRACGGCKCCRIKEGKGWFNDPQEAISPVWPIGEIKENILHYFDPESYITWDKDDFIGRKKQTLKECIKKLWEKGLRKFVFLGEINKEIKDILSENQWSVFICNDAKKLNVNPLPPGPEIIWINKKNGIADRHLRNTNETKRIYFIPENLSDPNRPDELFTERNHRHHKIKNFLERINK